MEANPSAVLIKSQSKYVLFEFVNRTTYNDWLSFSDSKSFERHDRPSRALRFLRAKCVFVQRVYDECRIVRHAVDYHRNAYRSTATFRRKHEHQIRRRKRGRHVLDRTSGTCVLKPLTKWFAFGKRPEGVTLHSSLFVQ